MKLNEFGKELRRLRLDRDELLKDMARRLRITPAFLSSIESGRKPVPADFVARVNEEYALSEAVRNRLQTAADMTRSSFEIKLSSSATSRHREAAAVLARTFPGLGSADLEELVKFMNERQR